MANILLIIKKINSSQKKITFSYFLLFLIIKPLIICLYDKKLIYFYLKPIHPAIIVLSFIIISLFLIIEFITRKYRDWNFSIGLALIFSSFLSYIINPVNFPIIEFNEYIHDYLTITDIFNLLGVVILTKINLKKDYKFLKSNFNHKDKSIYYKIEIRFYFLLSIIFRYSLIALALSITLFFSSLRNLVA